MKKKSILILVILIVIGLLSIKFIAKTKYVRYENLNIKATYEKMKKSGRPSIIIFSYDADCCENTRKFFNEYNEKAKKLMSDYEKDFNTLFINTGILDEEDKKNAVNIAKVNKVVNLPFILLIDKKGRTIKVIEGVFDDNEVRKMMDKVIGL